MQLLTDLKSVGVTLKFVIDGDEQSMQRLLDALPGEIRIGGQELSEVRIGVHGHEEETARVSILCEELSFEDEDLFLENG
jgi:hypothetical protein